MQTVIFMLWERDAQPFKKYKTLLVNDPQGFLKLGCSSTFFRINSPYILDPSFSSLVFHKKKGITMVIIIIIKVNKFSVCLKTFGATQL